MSPIEVMAELYRREPEAEPFESYLKWHLLHGHVHSTPDYFLMFVPAVKADLEAGKRPPAPLSGPADCWYVSGIAGDMAKAWRAEPFPLPWLAFERGAGDGKTLSIWPAERLRTRTQC